MKQSVILGIKAWMTAAESCMNQRWLHWPQYVTAEPSTLHFPPSLAFSLTLSHKPKD